jgi:hypothetical protein
MWCLIVGKDLFEVVPENLLGNDAHAQMPRGLSFP